MKRIGFVFKIRQDKLAEYKERHKDVGQKCSTRSGAPAGTTIRSLCATMAALWLFRNARRASRRRWTG